ncbi:MAG: hydroxymethylglutaryl-CoA reductase, degradative [Candidatus Heimdallarchaeota archaeon]|nr:hydroxymethylglutaryl-CoA reductase, degradative [Candidatus Heimdallarchaeota archaeon]
MYTSELPGFHKLNPQEKISAIKKMVNLSENDINILQISDPPVTIENIIGVMTVPIGVATNFIINGKDKLVTMAVEEASVVAAASNAAKMTRKYGGFSTTNTGSIMIGQIQVLDVVDPEKACQRLQERKKEIIELGNRQDSILVKLGGGLIDLETRIIETEVGKQIIVHLHVDTLDAMGANAVNTISEICTPIIEEITGGKVNLRILSNLADKRIVRATATFDAEQLGGLKIVKAIVNAWAFAEADPYRAATHNKGVMNAISAITLATANDWRAIEAGAHAFAVRDGKYKSLTQYSIDEDGNLRGSIELPLALGIVGGATKAHPTAQICLKIMDISKAIELAELVASVGLAQNVAALRALSDEGIQKGHMKLHAYNIASSIDGITPYLANKIAEIMISENTIKTGYALELFKNFKNNTG